MAGGVGFGTGSGGVGVAGGITSSTPAAIGSAPASTGQTSQLGSVVSLTNLVANSDALGKVIPRSWGHVVVGGALIWASPYYPITGEYDPATTEFYSNFPDGVGSPAGQGNTQAGSTTVTLEDAANFGLDLCYSFGFEGILGKRKIYRVKLNGTLVYDAVSGYVMDGIGFDTRLATSGAIPAAMKKYVLTGKYFYPGQTLIVFKQFYPKDWGKALPQSVEVEFVTEEALGEPSQENINGDRPTFSDRGRWLSDFTNRKQHYIDMSIGPYGGTQVYDIDTGERLDDVTFNGPAAPAIKAQGYVGTESGTMCGLLEAWVVPTGLYDQGVVVDLRTGYVAFLGYPTDQSININKYACLEANANTARVIGTAIFAPNRWDFTLSRGGGNVSVAGKTNSNFTAWTGWARDMHGYGSGTLVACRDNKITLIHAQGGAVQCAVPPTATVNSVVAFEEGCVAHITIPVPGQAGAGDSFLVSFSGSGALLLKRPTENSYLRETFGASGGEFSIPGNRYIGSTMFGYAYYTDLSSLIQTKYPAKSEYDLGFDPVTGQMFGVNALVGGDGNMYRYGPGLITARIPLMEFIRSLYVLADMYPPDQISWESDIQDEVSGAMLVQTVDVNDLVSSLCSLYRLNRRETTNGLHFFKNESRSLGLKIAATINVKDLAVEMTEDDIATPVKSKRQSENGTPVSIDLKFIDPNNNYKENTVSWRRVDAPVGASGSLNLALPLVMPPSEALYLVQQAVVTVQAATYTHEFRLPTALAAVLENGDVVDLVDGEYHTTVEITDMDHNGDTSASVKAVSVGAVNIVDIVVPPIEAPTPSAGGGRAPSAAGYVIDSPLLQRADDPGPGSVVLFEAIAPATPVDLYPGGYFARRPIVDDTPGEWASLPSFVNQRNPVVLRSKAALTNKRWTIDRDPLPFALMSGELPPAATIEELQASPIKNIAWYGAPGRWEIIKFLTSAGGALNGIMRGLRGTEINCGKHVVGDLIILAVDGIITEARATDKIGSVEEWRPVTSGQSFNSAASLPRITLQGNTARAYAPANVRLTPGAGGITISWTRRDRHYKWGLVDVETADPRSYRIQIMSGTTVVREYTVNEAESVLYSTADQNADGTIGQATLHVNVAQVGAIGPGLNETVTLDAA
jgi:hypothetical protein